MFKKITWHSIWLPIFKIFKYLGSILMLRNIKECLKGDPRCMKLCIVENNAPKKARKMFSLRWVRNLYWYIYTGTRYILHFEHLHLTATNNVLLSLVAVTGLPAKSTSDVPLGRNRQALLKGILVSPLNWANAILMLQCSHPNSTTHPALVLTCPIEHYPDK